MKALAIKTSTKTGKRFALVADGPRAVRNDDATLSYAPSDTFGVWAECKNYAAHVHGGIAVTWRYVARGLDRAAAEKLLNKRAA